MRPDFSEFSYGYAVTEELVRSLRAAVAGAPIMPSLNDEGKKGYDLKLPSKGKPVFLQFKLSDYLKKRSAREYQVDLLDVPYYRMHLRPTRHSDQHNLLLDLELAGEAVFYIAPEFHLPAELNDAYLRRAVISRSAAFRPSEIGALPDDDPHYLSFERGAPLAFRCSSDPIEVPKRSLKDGLLPVIEAADVQERDLGTEGLRSISDRMLEVLGRSEEREPERKKPVDLEGVRRIAAERAPEQAIGYMARTFFDAELLVIPSQI